MKRIATRQRLGQTGDTIAEVLIAIAVVSLVLVAAFAVVSRTAKNTRQTQEHSEALKYLEGQTEQLKARATTDATTLFAYTASQTFCFNASGTLSDIAGSADSDYDTAGCTFGDPPRYHLGVRQSTPNTFTATASWDGPLGTKDQVTIVYKAYP